MPTPKNGFQILNLHSKKHILKKKNIFLYTPVQVASLILKKNFFIILYDLKTQKF